MEFFNSLNLKQIKGGTKLKQGDLGSVLSYSLTDENGQEITSFDNKTAYINLVLDDKIWFTTTTIVDISRVTFRIDKAIPIGLYYLEIKIDDYIFPSDRDSIILIEEGSTPYDLKELVPNYDINMTLKGILSDLSQKGIDITDLKTKMNAIYNNALADHAEITTARGTYPNLRSRLEEVDNKQQQTTAQLAQKANKDEVTNVMTPKGTLAYASLPTSGNQVGWYYYCPDGDGAHGAGNYVWNGSSWFFGGTGDEGYTKLKNELNDKLGIDTVLLKSLRADYNEDVPMDNLANDFVYTLGDFSQVPKGTTEINLDIYSGGGYGEIFLYRPDATYQRLLVYRKRYKFVAGMNKVKIELTDKDFGGADYLKIAIFAETAGAFKTQSGFLYQYTNADPFTFYMEHAKIDTQVGGYVDAPSYWEGNVTTNKTYPCIDVYFTRPVEKRKKSVITVSPDGTKDFTTIMEAVRNAGDCDNNPVTILIYEGVYDEVVYLRNKHNISLKGVNRDKCIIKNTTGQYYATPVMVNGDFTIENLTLRMEENGFYPEYTDNVFTTYPGYALHIDGNSKDVSKETTGRIRNCTCYSEAFPAVGMGVNQNQTVIFENCEFVRNCTKDYFKRDNWKGAFVGHSSNYPTAPNQNLILKDCIFKSNYGYAGNVRGELGDSSAFTLTAINNTFYSDEKGKDCFDYTVGQSHLHPMSNGNTATNLNN